MKKLTMVAVICISQDNRVSTLLLNFYRTDVFPDAKSTVSWHWRQERTTIKRSKTFKYKCCIQNKKMAWYD